MPDAPIGQSPAGGPGSTIGFPIRGVIEGFYGTPWSWELRAEVMAWCHERGMNTYIYGPKDEPLHRHRWREPYGRRALAGFESLVAAETLKVGFGISPGLSFDYSCDDDRRALGAKVDQVLATGVETVALLLDDVAVRPGLGPLHAALTTWLHDHLDGRAALILTPTEYTGTAATPYLDALATGTPHDVAIGWTGVTVVCDEITVAQASARGEALGGRPPFIWDNYPVNDVLMADRLFMGPLRGREPGLAGVCSGYAANPMVQARASRPALASIAAFVSGADPLEGWRVSLGPLAVFAEACDGHHPRELVAAVTSGDRSPEVVAALEAWLVAAKDCPAPGLEDEVGPWLEQVHREARVGLRALNLLRSLRLAGEVDVASGERAIALAALWLPLRRGEVNVMGTRGTLRPVLAQDPAGAWVLRAGAVTEASNAIDDLARYVLAEAGGSAG